MSKITPENRKPLIPPALRQVANFTASEGPITASELLFVHASATSAVFQRTHTGNIQSACVLATSQSAFLQHALSSSPSHGVQVLRTAGSSSGSVNNSASHDPEVSSGYAGAIDADQIRQMFPAWFVCFLMFCIDTSRSCFETSQQQL